MFLFTNSKIGFCINGFLYSCCSLHLSRGVSPKISLNYSLTIPLLYKIRYSLHFMFILEPFLYYCITHVKNACTDQQKTFMSLLFYFYKKILYTRGTLRSIGILLLATIPTLYRDWHRSLN